MCMLYKSPMDLFGCALACPAAPFLRVVGREPKDFCSPFPILANLHKSCSKEWSRTPPARV